jgi:Fe-S oxidoreductase/nitrate reductase gamma subunit
MYAVMTIFVVVLVYGFYRHWRLWTYGDAKPPLDNLRLRLGRMLAYAFGQRKVVKRALPGLMHFLIYSGIVVLFIGTTLVFLDYDFYFTFFNQQFLRGQFYLGFEIFLDAFGIVAIVGVVVAGYRRYVERPSNLPSIRDDLYILSILLVICVTGFVMEGLRLAIRQPAWAPWSFVGYRLAQQFMSAGISLEAAVQYYWGLWWFHAILAFLGVASIPYTKLWHLATSPLNAFFMPFRPKGQLSKPFDLKEMMETGNFDLKVGAASVADFDFSRRLSFESCTVCGRCSNACPATAAGTLLSPMHLILKLRDQMRAGFFGPEEGGKQLHGGVVDPEELWACTACRACVQECPVLIDHVDAIVDMRRHLVAEGKLDRKKRDMLTSLANVGNPYGLPADERLKWADGLGVKTLAEDADVEVLYWVGCAGSYDPRNQNVSRAMVRILQSAGVKFGVLGSEERCNCEVARRIGEEGRFQQAALELVEVFKKYGVRKIVTQCPHCFNTFKNEYSQLGFEVEVVHHTQYIAGLLAEGRLKLKPGAERTVTFHDPCYLGRFNDIYDQPREVIAANSSVKLVEMERHHDRSFCCGAGGANFWYTVEQKKKINAIRFEEALQTRANIVGTACPFCTSMFVDAANISDASGKTLVRDVAELVAERIE